MAYRFINIRVTFFSQVDLKAPMVVATDPGRHSWQLEVYRRFTWEGVACPTTLPFQTC